MAVFAVPHLLYTFHGGLAGGENWSVGLRTQSAVVAPEDMQIFADYAANAFEAFWSDDNIRSFVGKGTDYAGCTVRYVDTGGLTVHLAEGLPVAAGPIPGIATLELPDQVAVCVTLLTPKAGRSGKGRIFLPLTGGDQGVSPITGGMVSNRQNGFCAAVTQLVAALNGNKDVFGAKITKPVPAAGYRLAIQSRKPPGAQSPITSVQVGSIYDTIRGRRSKLSEVRYTVAVPTPIYIG